jgi:methyl-accepting chemotaxis protein
MITKVQYRLTLWFVVFSLIPYIILYFTSNILSPTAPDIWVTLILLIGSTIMAFIVARKFTQPIAFASKSMAKIIRGELHHRFPQKVVRDERGDLILRCQEMTNYLKEMTDILRSLAQGNFDVEFQSHSETDELEQACTDLVRYGRNVTTTLKSLAEGNISTAVIPLSGHDRLGQALQRLSERVPTFVSQVGKIVENITTMSHEMMERMNLEIQSIEKLLTSAESTSSSMAEMQASVEEVGMNIEALAASFEATSSSIGQMGTSISQVTRNSEKLSEFVEKTSSIIAQAVSGMEKVSENAENSKILSSDTMRDASKGHDAMKKMSESVQTISETVESASLVIHQLEARSDEIGSVLDVIDEIADQTSLLALNASIIAAQAGEHGKGFAVVADEIKELANRVSESTKEISRIVKTVQQDSAKAAAAMEEGNAQVKEGLKLTRLAGDALEKIILGAQWSANVATDIADSIQQQTAMNQSIEESIQDVVNVATENTRATKEQEIGASRVMEAVAKMTALADQVHKATIEQTKGSAEVINATEEISALIRNSIKNAQHLMEAIKELTQYAETLTDMINSYTMTEP